MASRRSSVDPESPQFQLKTSYFFDFGRFCKKNIGKNLMGRTVGIRAGGEEKLALQCALN